MKRVVDWIKEEHVTVFIVLLGVGMIFSQVPDLYLLSALCIYAVVVLAVLKLGHGLYLRIKK